MAVRASSAKWVVLTLAVGCGHGGSPGPASVAAHEDGVIAVEKKDAYPSVVRIVRDGDPRPAVAMVIQTSGGSYASTGLAALLESRLVRAGFTATDSRADRDSLRVRSLVESASRAAEFVQAARAALGARVTPGSPELALVARRLAALRRHPLEAPIVQAVARCTGELGALPSDAALDVGSSEGVQQLEAARSAAYGALQVAFAAAGAQPVVEAAASAVHRGEPWPRGATSEIGSTPEDQMGVYVAADRPAGTARLTVAVSTPSADVAAAGSRRAGDPDGPLATRLRALAVPFRLVEARATVRPHGGCLAVTLETARVTPPHLVADGAALAAALARQELDDARSTSVDPGAAPRSAGWPLGPAGRTAVRLANDPRDAAELGGVWSLSAAGAPDEKPSYAIALAVPTPAADAREAGMESGVPPPVARRFAASLERATAAWNAPIGVERVGKLERGQGELWLVLGSPCGALAEGTGDPGMTALALMTALASQPGGAARGVTLEPWVAPEGVGVVAHAPRAAGESVTALAARVAEEAARVLLAAPFSPSALATARALLLNRVGDGASAEGRAMSALASALVPGHPSWLAPFGAWEELSNAGIDAASLRWSTLAGGPLRLAVLANETDEQIDWAARTVDRWLVRSLDAGRACAPVEPPGASKSGTVQVTFPSSSSPLWQALLGFPVPPHGTPEGALGELTLAGLSGPDGWLGRATSSASLAATAQARLVGGSRAAALVIDVRAPEATLDAAVAQVRALLQRLRQGAIGQADLERSQALRDRWELEASLDPRRRLLNLWRDAGGPVPSPAGGGAGSALASATSSASPSVNSPASLPPPSLDGWRAWIANTLLDEKLVVVIAKPKR